MSFVAKILQASLEQIIYMKHLKKIILFLSCDSYFDKLKNYKITSILIAFAI